MLKLIQNVLYFVLSNNIFRVDITEVVGVGCCNYGSRSDNHNELSVQIPSQTTAGSDPGTGPGAPHYQRRVAGTPWQFCRHNRLMDKGKELLFVAANPSIGRFMATMVVTKKNNNIHIKKNDKSFLLNVRVSPPSLFADAVSTVINMYHEAKQQFACSKSSNSIKNMIPLSEHLAVW